ncbi:protein tramtrack, beta isoform [Diaphorina citri]|uniref:Protein tramtrack, beta isoform n=1 Tax=Diaphorina citri TaxID=121845 RepID=A0A1S3D040_DIACI|nr:protein tramtrack, beta isoform [Diaphorina citri]
MESSQQYCLRWKYHHSNLQSMFSQLLERECFCDVTLACEGKHIRAHKVMLSACSTYFDAILSQHDETNPIVVFKDVRFEDLRALVQFMYKGEIKIENTQLTTLLKTAEELRIKGLAEVSWRDNQPSSTTREEEAEEDEGTDQNVWLRSPGEITNPPPQLEKRKQKTMRELIKMRKTCPTQNPEHADKEDDDIEIIDHNNQGTNEQNTGNKDTAHEQTEEYGQKQMDDMDKEDSESDNDNRDLNEDDYDEMPMPIAPETVYDTPGDMEDENEIRERRIKREKGKDENGNEEEEEEDEEFEMPGMPAHLTNSAFSSLLDGQEDDDGSKTNTSTEEKTIDYSKYSYVVKMNDFLDQGGRRPQFWEENSTRRVMEAIKNKELEMKQAAEIMGVSYGTLYGRYRDAYGCLKHPYRVKEFWSEQGPSEILGKLRRKELTLFRAGVHCRCDKKFYDCLKTAADTGDQPSQMVGYMYFNLLETQCFQEDYPITNCTKYP